MFESLEKLLKKSDIYENIDSVIITAFASPIASAEYNKKLSINRATAMKSHLCWQYPDLSDKITICSEGIDWAGFWSIVQNTPDMPSRDKILKLQEGKYKQDEILKILRTIGGKETYNYLLNKVYPRLQYADVRIIMKDRRSIPKKGSPLKQIIERDTIWIEKVIFDTVRIQTIIRDTIRIEPEEKHQEYYNKPSPVEKKTKPFLMAVKTNLAYDVLLLPNLALEIPFGSRYQWSAEVEGNWSWWDKPQANHLYHRVQIAGAELRRWFGDRTNDPLHGFYVGLYGYGGTYDFRLFADELRDHGQLSNRSISAGFSFGYSMPISRKFNMEFGLGLGYFGGEYDKYYISECDNNKSIRESTHQRNYFGPTKAKISLVWLIGDFPNKTIAMRYIRLIIFPLLLIVMGSCKNQNLYDEDPCNQGNRVKVVPLF